MPPLRRAAVVLILILLAANGAALAWRPAPPARFAGVTAAQIPEGVAGYQSLGDMPMPDDVKAALSSATLIARSYGASDGGDRTPIDFILIGGTDRSALHDPRSCLVGDGWRIENDRSETLPGAGSTPVRACRIVKDARGDEPAAAYDMLYLYVVDGRVVERVTDIRARMLGAALLGRKGSPTYFLRFVRPASADAAPPDAEDGRLREFAAGMWSELRPTLTKTR
jgi:hypothetical protein